MIAIRLFFLDLLTPIEIPLYLKTLQDYKNDTLFRVLLCMKSLRSLPKKALILQKVLQQGSRNYQGLSFKNSHSS